MRLEFSRRFNQEQPSSPGGPIEWEAVRMTLFAQEWEEGQGPDIQGLIAHVNGLSTGELCQCSHTGGNHEGTGRCQVYSCGCSRLRLRSEVALEEVRHELREARKDVLKVSQQRDLAIGAGERAHTALEKAEARATRATNRLTRLKAEYDI
jgi:hypothetical protein